MTLGWAILASFFRHFCSVQCLVARSCIDFLTSREEVHQQDFFSILDDCGYNLARRVGCSEILCWRGITFVSSMTCAPKFHHQWQLGLTMPHCSVCTEADVISINSCASVYGVHSQVLGPNVQVLSCDEESRERFPALLVRCWVFPQFCIFTSVVMNNAFHMTCHLISLLMVLQL